MRPRTDQQGARTDPLGEVGALAQLVRGRGHVWGIEGRAASLRRTLAHSFGAALGALGKGREGLVAQAVVVLDQVDSARGETSGQLS